MRNLTTAAILSAFWATSAGAAVIQFDTLNGFGPVKVAEAAANGAGSNGKVPDHAKGRNARTLASSVGGGSIGMWVKPKNVVVAPATQGATGSLVLSDDDGGLGVVPLPGAMVLLFGALGALLAGAGLRRSRMIS